MDWIRIAVMLIYIALPVYAEDNVPALVIAKLSSDGTENLVCFLRKQPNEDCKKSITDFQEIPLRLKQLYRRMGEKLKEYVKSGSLASAPTEIFSELHPVIFYLMPNGDERLNAGGQALARIVRSQGGDAAAIIAAAALLRKADERDTFTSQLSGVNLPEKSQKVLGEFLAEWFRKGDSDWKFERFSKALNAGNPLIGSLPPPYLTSLDALTIERFLFLLSRWESRGITREEQWYSKGKMVTRTWSYMVEKVKYPHALANWTTTSYKRYPFLLLGFTPDELLGMAEPHRDLRANLFQLKFEKLQARAIFEAIFSKKREMKATDIKNGIPVFTVPVLTMLSPHQLAHYFNHSIADFGVLKNPSAKSFIEPSLATAKQLAHCLIAQSMYRRLQNTSDEGKSNVNGTSESSVVNVTSNEALLQNSTQVMSKDFINVGHFVYSLNLSYFINQTVSEISLWQLRLMDSRNIIPRQGRLLTKHLILRLESDSDASQAETRNISLHVTADELIGFGPGLLRGLLPTSVIVNLDMRRIPQRIIQHLLTTDIPWMNGALLEERQSLRALAILQKVRNEIDQEWVIKSIISNRESAQLLKYLTPQEVIPISQSVMRIATFITLSQLHPKTLSVLLDVALPELLSRGPGGGKWASESLASGAVPLLRGLRCKHLELLDYYDVILVLGQFNKQRQARLGTKYQPFPKNLQHCAVRALAFHLEAKASLWNEKGVTNVSSKEILDTFEDSDVESVGGFVIAGLPKRILQFLGADAVRSLGQLSSYELLSALYRNHQPADIAALLLKQLGIEADREIGLISSNETKLENITGRLGEEWHHWYAHEPSLLPVLFGSLLVYLPPDKVEPSSLKWALETANPGDNLVCLEANKRESWYLNLKNAFGEPETWTSSTLSIIGDFLIVVPKDMLQRIPADSWESAADSLVEKSRYFHRIISMPRGMENYVQVCTKFLEAAEKDSYVNAAKTIARYYLLASQLQMNGIVFYSDLLKNSSTDNQGRFSQGSLVPVPGLKKPSIISGNVSEEQAILRKERLDDALIGPNWNMDHKITCDAIRAVGPELACASLNSEDIELMSTQEVWDCVDVLGSIDLEDSILKKVWMQINKTDGLQLQDLGKVVKVLTDEDLMKFNTSISSNLDDVYVLGRELPDWDRVNLWANKILPEESDKVLTVEEVAALGGLVCGIPETVANKTLTPEVVLQAAPFLAEAFSGLKDKGCPPVKCIETLGRLAAAGLGSPSDGWTEMELETVDILAAGFTEEIWSALKIEDYTMSGLQMSAVECMPDKVLKGLSTSQVAQLSPLVAMGLDERKNNLTESQRSAVEEFFSSPFDQMTFHEDNNSTITLIHEVEEEIPEEEVQEKARATTVSSGAVLHLLTLLFLIYLR